MNVRLAHKVVGFVSVLCVQLLGNHPCKIEITDWRRSADYWLKTVEEPELMVGLLRCVLGGCKEQGAYVFVGTSSTRKDRARVPFFLGTTGLDVPIMLAKVTKEEEGQEAGLCGTFCGAKTLWTINIPRKFGHMGLQKWNLFTVGSYIL